MFKSVIDARCRFPGKLETRNAGPVIGVVRNAKPEKSKISKTAKRPDEGRLPQGM